MRIMICGSMSNAERLLRIKETLIEQGHDPILTKDIQVHIDDPTQTDDLEKDLVYCKENQILLNAFKEIESCDAILIANFEKNGISGYIGTSTLMELGVAYYLRKKLFILKPVPDSPKTRWAHEVMIMEPVILDDDFSKIR